MGCINCGAYLHLSSDLGKAAQVIRIEEIATNLGIDVSLDMVPDDELRGSGERLMPTHAGGDAWPRDSSCFKIGTHDPEEQCQESRQEGRANVSHCDAAAAY